MVPQQKKIMLERGTCEYRGISIIDDKKFFVRINPSKFITIWRGGGNNIYSKKNTPDT